MTDHTNLLEEILGPIHDRRTELLAQRDALKAQIAVVDDELRTLNRVLAAAGPQNKPGRKPKDTRSNGAKVWRPAQQRIDAVETFVVNAGVEHTANEIADALSMSRETVRRCLDVLRDEEKVRLSANKTQRGGALYAPMPS